MFWPTKNFLESFEDKKFPQICIFLTIATMQNHAENHDESGKIITSLRFGLEKIIYESYGHAVCFVVKVWSKRNSQKLLLCPRKP